MSGGKRLKTRSASSSIPRKTRGTLLCPRIAYAPNCLCKAGYIMKRCTRCIFPETIPGITFDGQGVCSFCQRYKPIEYLGEDKLLEHIEYAKSKHREYDCVIPVSGGRDSSYVLYLAKKRYNLKVLAVNYNNEFMTEQAVINMHTACKILNVEFISLGSKFKVGKKFLLNTLKYNLNYSRGFRGICRSCLYGIRAVSFMMAQKYKIPLVLWGNSKIEHIGPLYSSIPLCTHERENKFDARYLAAQFYRYLQRLELPAPGNFIRNIFLVNPKLHNKNIRQVSMYEYIPRDSKKIEETIVSELGWRPHIDATNSWRMDCKLTPLYTFYFHIFFGCSEHCFGWHNMINEKQISREEALKSELNMKPAIAGGIKDFLQQDIGLSDKDIEKMISLEKDVELVREALKLFINKGDVSIP